MGSAVWYGQSGVASCCLQVSDASPFMQRGPKFHKAFLTLTPTLIGIKNGTVIMSEKGADDIHKGGSFQLILLENVETGKDSQLPSPRTHLAFNIVGPPPHPPLPTRLTVLSLQQPLISGQMAWSCWSHGTA